MWISKEGDVRKQEFLDAAIDVFSEIGYERATINDILKKVGVTKGSFYYYFKSKEDVLKAAASRQAEILIGIIRNVSDSEEETLNKINSIVHKILEYRMDNAEKKLKVFSLMQNEGNAYLAFKIFQNVILEN